MPKSESEISVFQTEYRNMSKEQVIAQYEHDYQGFLAILFKIPERKLHEKFMDSWGIAEITAHMAAWNLQTIEGIKMVMSGSIPWFFDDKARINAFNAEQTSLRRNQTIEQNLQEMAINHKTLVSYLQRMSPQRFHQSFGQVWKGQEATPSLVCSYRHYLHHTQDIRKWLGQRAEVMVRTRT